MGSLRYAILGCLLRNCFVPLLWIRPTDPTDRYSRAWKPPGVPCSQFDHYACFPASFRSFSLFQRPPLPPSWRNEKDTAEKLLARAESNGYKRVVHREKDSA